MACISDVAARAITPCKGEILFSLPASQKVCFLSELQGLRGYMGSGVEETSDGKVLKC